MTQDAGFGIEQLVEVAARALSLGINDPFTAILCLDRLGTALSQLATRRMLSSQLCDDGHLRVIIAPLLSPEIVDAAFSRVRQYGRGSLAVILHLLETLETAGSRTTAAEDLSALRRQADLTYSGSEALPELEDRRIVAVRYAKTLQALGREIA